ncbi:MAG: fatty acid desaturase [Ignavibacteria bacterium]|nr:fatty acid desaturase [Ignavibacteria bacterium]
MGIMVAATIILFWVGNLYLSLSVPFEKMSLARGIFHFLIQTYLFTGLFITAHDSMHGTVSKNRQINRAIGYFTTFLYAGLWFKKLLKNHRLHHKFPAASEDPDYAEGNFIKWYFSFMMKYVSVLQIIIMAVFFNLLKLFAEDLSIIIFWAIPALLSSVQLFYFGTYAPHKKPHTSEMLPHNARTLRKGHIYAMLTCYFFGYHAKHHINPGIPWWKLYQTK